MLAVCVIASVDTMPLLDLDPDQLLSTTRAVRKRLDFDRPVPDDLIRECVRLALQAPSGGNTVTMRFVVVRDPELKRAVAGYYKQSYDRYRAARTPTDAQSDRVANSADYLSEHMAEAPALVIGCNEGSDRQSAQRGMGNILPAMWSFMLAARARSLGTAWTTLHLPYEREVAEVLRIPYDTVAQAVMTPMAFTKGTDFRPAARPEPDEVIRWDRW
jgi:nitroreductase